MSGEVERVARAIYEAASDAADCPWEDLQALGLDALYLRQAEALAPVLADVWDAGHDACPNGCGRWGDCAPNPYRADALDQGGEG